ncbi:hypothetical protein [Chitinophaga arvensicola]|nr:hypothetical protein [Chitinophaga arvensicola]
MKTSYLLLALGAAIFTSCHQQGQQQTAVVTDSLPVEREKTSHCYEKVMGRDTIQLRLTMHDSVATGTLVYNFFEKDKNKGTFNGIISKGIVRGKYVFYSEGIESARPVIFKISDHEAFEALPDSIDHQGLPVFSTQNEALKFDTMPLVEGACQ